MTTQHDDRCESLAMHLAAANHALDLFHAELAEILDNPFAAKADPRIVEVQSHAALASTALAQSRAHLATFRGLDNEPRAIVEEQQT